METRRSRVHVFRGQDLAEPVLGWLRSKRPKDDPVEKLVRLEVKRADFQPGATTEENPSFEICELVRANRSWQFGLELGVDLEGIDWTVSWKTEPTEVPPMGRLAFRNCLLLKREGLLDRIRQCARSGCEEWFFARFDHQKCHSDECRVAMLSADEARKEARRQYMRTHRATKKKLKKLRSYRKEGKKP